MKHGASVPTIGVVAEERHEVADLDATTRQQGAPIDMRRRSESIAGVVKRGGEFIIPPAATNILNAEGI
jgi:hypothetical protein